MRTKTAHIIVLFIVAAILIGATMQSGSVSASAPATVAEQTAAQPAGPIDVQELEAFLDSLLASELAEAHVPGAVVAVVADGSPLSVKGYGYADLEAQTPVDPERTLFRIASVSKLITWTAVMQLVEQGTLSLDTDVNQYLDFEIPATFSEPITLRHLLSHTSGFEEVNLNIWKLRVADMSPLGDFLKANLPVRVLPPGEASGYSNYGASLAGYIVERVSGLPFNEYTEQNIFAPLGMAHSSFRQPLPEPLAEALATGYNYSNGQYLAGGYEFLQTAPGGSASAPASDMARFMIAHLANGELDGRRILQEETAIQMHSQLYTPDPRLASSMAHGFLTKIANGQQILWHDGATFLFHSGLYLLPEQQVGLFISTNGAGGGNVVKAVSEAFLDHYYPGAEMPEPQSAASFADRIAPFLGEYTPVRSNFSSFEKMSRLMGTFNVGLGSDGNLELSWSGTEVRLAEVEPGLLQDIGNPENQFVYRTGADGRRFLMNGTLAFLKLPWYGLTNLHRLLFLSGGLLFLGAMIAWPIGSYIGRRKRLPGALPTPLPARLGHWTAALFGLLLMLSLLGFGALFADILPAFGAPRLFFETPPLLDFLLSLSYLLAGLALAILTFAVLAFVRRYWSPAGRIFYALLALMALLLTWALAYWDLLL